MKEKDLQKLNIDYDVFLSYQFSGIEPKLRDENILKMVKEIEKTGKTVFCANVHGHLFKEVHNMNYDEILEFALSVEEKCKEINFYIIYPIESGGMKAELEHAKKYNIPGKLIILNELQHLDWVQLFIKYCGKNIKILDKF